MAEEMSCRIVDKSCCLIEEDCNCAIEPFVVCAVRFVLGNGQQVLWPKHLINVLKYECQRCFVAANQHTSFSHNYLAAQRFYPHSK